ncbi:hypothetical protein OIV83_002078 [Microbotryomycetes sp. JL201]|nr:hypothetical protein OIV83_002078 [Microbotryomycetes sp. JL201]
MRSRWYLWASLIWLTGAALASNESLSSSVHVAIDDGRQTNGTSVVVADTDSAIAHTRLPDIVTNSTATDVDAQPTTTPAASVRDDVTRAPDAATEASSANATTAQPVNVTLSSTPADDAPVDDQSGTSSAADPSCVDSAENVPPTASPNAHASSGTDDSTVTTGEQPNDAQPELLSFQEWREKYVVAAASNSAQTGKHQPVKHTRIISQDGAQLSRSDAQVAVDPLDEIKNLSQVRPQQADSPSAESAQPRSSDLEKVDGATAPSEALATNGRGLGTVDSPFQPLPNVGTGTELDPLLLLRDRSNYALADCSAKLLRSSKQSKGASSILVEKKDRYMLTPCNVDPKFVEVELCDEIQIDTLVLANFELFSSMFKHFQVSCSVEYPGKADSWHDLGRYRARNARGVQVFATLPVPAFCRFIRINFLSHYGSEYFCPVSLIRVYGYTQLDAYRESQRREAEEARLRGLLEPAAEEESIEIVVPTIISTDSVSPTSVQQSAMPSEAFATDSAASKATTVTGPRDSPSSASAPMLSPTPTLVSSETDVLSYSRAEAIATSMPNQSEVEAESKPNSSTASEHPAVRSDAQTSTISTFAGSSSILESSSKTIVSAPSDTGVPLNETVNSVAKATTATSDSAASSNATASVPMPQRPVRNDTRPLPPLPPRTDPQPGESIFATIMKRLASLEHNQTLSVHFMEVQSGMLRDVLTRLDRRLVDLEGSRQRQEQTFRQALLDAERLRLELDRERMALAAQVTRLTREVRFDRHLSIAELIGLLALFVFVGLTRGSPTAPFGHLAAMQHFRQGSVSPRFGLSRPSSPTEEQMNFASSPGVKEQVGQTLTRTSSLKRQSNASKLPGLRRHYGVGSTSKAHLSRASRTWTPPVRHSSAPPEDLFALNLVSALDPTRSSLRRPSRKHATMPPESSSATNFDLDSRDELSGTSRFAISVDNKSSVFPTARPASSLSNYRSYRPRLMSRKSTTANDADTEPSEAEERLWTSDGDPSESNNSRSRSRRSSRDSVGSSQRQSDGTNSGSDDEDEDEQNEPSRGEKRSSPSPVIVVGANPFISRSMPALPLDSDKRVNAPPFEVDPKSPEPTPEPERLILVKQEPFG